MTVLMLMNEFCSNLYNIPVDHFKKKKITSTSLIAKTDNVLSRTEDNVLSWFLKNILLNIYVPVNCTGPVFPELLWIFQEISDYNWMRIIILEIN